VNLKSQTLWNFAPILVTVITGLVSVPLYYRFLGADMYALWMYVATLSGSFGFMDLGIGVSVGRYVGLALGRGDHEAAQEYWSTGQAIVVPLLLLFGVAFALIGWFGGPLWFKGASEHLTTFRFCVLAGTAGLVLAYFSQTWVVLTNAHLDFRFSGTMRTAMVVLTVIPALVLAWLTHNPAWTMAWAPVVGLLQLAILMARASGKYGLHFRLAGFRMKRLHEMMGYTLKIFFNLVLGAFSGGLDRIVLGKIAPAAEFTYYSVALNAGSRLQGLGSAAMAPVFHSTNRSVGQGDDSGAGAVYVQGFRFIFRWMFHGCCLIAVWHHQLLEIWLGRELGEHVAPLIVPIFIGCAIGVVMSISAAQMPALGRVHTLTAFQVLQAAVTACAVYFGWTLGGIVGVAWGVLSSRIVGVAQDLFLASLIKARGLLSFWTLREVGFQVLVAVMAASVAGIFPMPWVLAFFVLHGAYLPCVEILVKKRLATA